MNIANLETHRPVIRDGFIWEPIPEGCLLFEEATGKLVTLNPAAEAVLGYCDGELTVAEIIRELESEFGVESIEAAATLSRLIDERVITPPPA